MRPAILEGPTSIEEDCEKGSKSTIHTTKYDDTCTGRKIATRSATIDGPRSWITNKKRPKLDPQAIDFNEARAYHEVPKKSAILYARRSLRKDTGGDFS